MKRRRGRQGEVGPGRQGEAGRELGREVGREGGALGPELDVAYGTSDGSSFSSPVENMVLGLGPSLVPLGPGLVPSLVPSHQNLGPALGPAPGPALAPAPGQNLAPRPGQRLGLGLVPTGLGLVLTGLGLVLNTTNEVLSKLFSTPMNQNHSRDYPLDNMFDSNYLDQEYKMLGDILTHSKPTSPSAGSSVTGSGAGAGSMNPVDSFMSLEDEKFRDTRPFISLGVSQPQTQPLHNRAAGGAGAAAGAADMHDDISNASDTNDITSHFTNTSSHYVSPMDSHQVYKSVKDVYANDIINFDYPQSYHSLTRFLKTRFLGKNLPEAAKNHKRNNLLIILKLIASYRPTFISAHKSLYKPWDLQFLEMTFQRSLIDFEKLSHLNSSPTIIWRRTGEIVSMSNDLISLLGLDLNDILSKRTFIMELMYDDDSIVNYFRLFKSVAVGNLHSSIITKCKLIKQDDPQGYIEFCSVWTVKRDLFDIPMLILGQFLPVLSPAEGFRMY